MKKMVCLFVVLWICFNTFSQFTVKVIVNEAATRQNEDIYVAGNFNSWNPKDDKYKLKPFGAKRKQIVLKDMPAGTYAFKFTRGNWDKVETLGDGRNVEDKIIEVTDDVTKEYTVAGWKDDYPDKPKPYTASPQVKILDTAFVIPQLNRKRRIWLYLPKGYSSSNEKYPVLYMHDGQNLFNEQTAPFGEWGVDEALDSLQKFGKCIVVAVDNGGATRVTEYNAYDNKEFGKEEGKEYVDFLVNTLKPFIDKKYRTKTDAPNTFIAGSSMGGLISFYAMIKHPETFGAAGIFSPAFWTAPQLYNDAKAEDLSKQRLKYYFYAGGQESVSMIADTKKMAAIIDGKPHVYKQVTTLINPIAKHNEAAWRKEFPSFYKWLFNK